MLFYVPWWGGGPCGANYFGARGFDPVRIVIAAHEK